MMRALAGLAVSWGIAARWLWSLPVTLFGLLVFVWCKPRAPRWRWVGHHGTRGILEVELGRWFGGYGAATFGHLQGYLPGQDREHHRPHEDAHTWQGDLLGFLNLIAYGLFWVVLMTWFFVRGVEIDPVLGAGRTRALRAVLDAAYWHNPLEAWARAWE